MHMNCIIIVATNKVYILNSFELLFIHYEWLWIRCLGRGLCKTILSMIASIKFSIVEINYNL